MAEARDRPQRDEGGTSEKITVGIASADPGPTRSLLEGFCAALSTAAKCRVTGVGLGHYRTLLDAIDRGEVDVTWLPPILAVQAISRGRIVPIALPVRGGFSCYSTALFVREESTIYAPRDLIGARAAWVDRQSAAGYLIIRAHLRSIGVNLNRAFASDQFLGSHNAVARAVIEGNADVGATYAHLDPKTLATSGHASSNSAPWGSAKVRVIAQVGPIPADVIAVRARAPTSVKALLQRMLVFGQHVGVRQAAGALFSAESFVAPLSEHLRPLTTLLGGLESTSEAPMSTVPRTRR